MPGSGRLTDCESKNEKRHFRFGQELEIGAGKINFCEERGMVEEFGLKDAIYKERCF